MGLSSIFAALPLLTLFVLLGGLRWKAQWAALVSLAVALAVAVLVYGMPVGQALDAGLLGAVFSVLTVLWIVINAIWIYNMTVKTGHFEVLRRSFASISEDQRVQAIIVAFCFGALIEALAGAGTPVAVTAVMLIALGFQPIKAATVALVANTAPVAFGALAVPITTLSEVTSLPYADLGAMVGRQTPLVGLLVPLVLVFMVDGRRGVSQAWPVALVGGISFALGQFAFSNYISVPLADVAAALISAGCIVIFIRFWKPVEAVIGEAFEPAVATSGFAAANSEPERVSNRVNTSAIRSGGNGSDGVPGGSGRGSGGDSRKDALLAYAPYAIIIAVFVLAQLPFVKTPLSATVIGFPWPGLNITNSAGEAVGTDYTFNFIPSTGTLLFVSGLVVIPLLGVGLSRALRTYGETFSQMKWAILTIVSVLALAFIMNLSGQTITLGLWMAGAGAFFAFLSPIIGWLGVAVTGSDNSTNALFGALQVAAAKETGLSPVLLAASNSSGGVMGKMLSPQSLAIAAAATGLVGREGDVFRRVIGWSLLMLLLICVLVVLQSTVLSWMVP